MGAGTAGAAVGMTVAGTQVCAALHCCPAGHDPQWAAPPHPSGVSPHCTPCTAQMFGVGVQHWWMLLHSSPAAQVPQLSVPPQPSETVPQYEAQVVGWQAHWKLELQL
jgi:hypothetical protein